MALYTIFGVVGTCFWVSITTAIAEQTSEEYRGRVFSLYQAIRSPMLVISIGLGMPLVHEIGSVRMFQYSGTLEVVLAIAAMLYAPKVKQNLAVA
jgi:MFS family permease